jgi:DNA polymerase-1
MEQKVKSNIVLIDGWNIFYQHYQRHTAKDGNAEPIGGFIGTINFIQKIIQKFRAQECYVVFDGPNAGFRRKQIFKEYKDKRGRKTGRVINVMLNENLTETYSNEDYQLNELFNCLRLLPIKIITAEFYEADDMIAYLLRRFTDDNCFICSMDRDYLQLVNDNVFVYSPQKQILYTKETIKEVYEVPVENLLYYRSVVGDSSDKLIGLKGFKSKTLLELVSEIKTTIFDSIGDFIKHLEVVEGKGKNIQKLHDSKEQLLLMYQLMYLSGDLSLGAANYIEGIIAEQKTKTFTKFGFKSHLSATPLKNFIKDYDLWIRPFIFLK